MVDLPETSPFEGLDLPLSAGGATLDVLAPAPLFSIAPFAGRTAEVAAALGAADLTTGAVVSLPAGRLIWTGLGQWMLQAQPPDLAGAAVTDQSDAFAGLRLTGPDAARGLARLVPIDLHPAAFPPGAAARTALGHMMAILVAIPDGYEIFVMRSFARTAVHEVATALRSVAAIAELRRA